MNNTLIDVGPASVFSPRTDAEIFDRLCTEFRTAAPEPQHSHVTERLLVDCVAIAHDEWNTRNRAALADRLTR